MTDQLPLYDITISTEERIRDMKFFYSQAKPDIFRVFGACPIFFERDSDDEEDVWGLRSDTKCRKSLVKEGGQRNDDGALIGASADTKNVSSVHSQCITWLRLGKCDYKDRCGLECIFEHNPLYRGIAGRRVCKHYLKGTCRMTGSHGTYQHPVGFCGISFGCHNTNANNHRKHRRHRNKPRNGHTKVDRYGLVDILARSCMEYVLKDQ